MMKLKLGFKSTLINQEAMFFGWVVLDWGSGRLDMWQLMEIFCKPYPKTSHYVKLFWMVIGKDCKSHLCNCHYILYVKVVIRCFLDNSQLSVPWWKKCQSWSFMGCATNTWRSHCSHSRTVWIILWNGIHIPALQDLCWKWQRHTYWALWAFTLHSLLDFMAG